MISGIFLVGERSNLLLHKRWIDDYSMNQVRDYILNVATKEIPTFPAHKIENAWFIHYCKGTVCYVAVCTKESVNVTLVVDLLSSIPTLYSQIFPSSTSDLNLWHISDMHAIIDELVVAGMPMSLTVEQLRSRIAPDSEPDKIQAPEIDHMAEGCYIDIIETLIVLLNANGEMIESLVEGQIQAQKNFQRALALQLTLSDPILQVLEGQKRDHGQLLTCKLGGNITPLPSEDPYQLTFKMSDRSATVCEYTCKHNIRLPLKILWKVDHAIETRMHVQIESEGHLEKLVIKVPLPDKATKTKHEETKGKAKLVQEENAVVWKFKKFNGKATLNISSKMLSLEGEVTSRRINASFTIQNDREHAQISMKTARAAPNAPIFWRNVIQTQQYEVSYI